MKKSADIRSFFKNASNIPKQVTESGSKKHDLFQNPEELPQRQKNVSLTESSSIEPNQELGSANSTTDLGTLVSGPSRPVLDFPKTQCGDKLRSFSVKYYEDYKWLEYSVIENKVFFFCMPTFLRRQ